jgi:hypothetical protein
MTIARCRESEIGAENKVKLEINQLIKHQTTFPFSFWPFISRTEVPNLLDPPSSLISHFVPPPTWGPTGTNVPKISLLWYLGTCPHVGNPCSRRR